MNFSTLDFSDEFLEDLLSSEFSQKERLLFLKALRLLEVDQTHPSLRVHELKGELRGTWSASASRQLRFTFRRQPNGRKLLYSCSRHYGD